MGSKGEQQAVEAAKESKLERVGGLSALTRNFSPNYSRKNASVCYFPI